MISVLEDTRFDGKPPVRRSLVALFQRNKGRGATKAVVLGMKRCMCAKFRFLGEEEMQDLVFSWREMLKETGESRLTPRFLVWVTMWHVEQLTDK